MHLAVAVVLSCLAVTLAEESCGVLERIKVQQQWASVYGAENDRLAFSKAVWKDFFKRHPEEVKRFSEVNGGNIYSGDFQAHMVRVFAGFDLLVGTLGDDALFSAAMAHYNTLHVGLGVDTAIVKEFGKSLGNVLPDFVKGRFALDAWRPCYAVIAEGVAEVSGTKDKQASEDKAAAENEV